MSDEVIQLIDELTVRFGPAAQHLWDLAVRQASLEGTVLLLFGFFGTIVLWTVWAGASRWYWKREVARKPEKATYSFDRPDTFPIFFSLLVPAFGSLVTIPMLYFGILWAANPEWAAIQVLTRLLPQ